MTYQPDATDRRILLLLQENAKLTIKEVASSLGLTTTPVFDRIKRLEKEGLITRYTALVNKEQLGVNLVAFCSVTLESHHLEYLEQFVKDIKNIKEVVECYHLAGTIDYLLKIYVSDMSGYQEFITQKLATLSNISRVESSFVMTEIKQEYILPTLS
jgi:DNA-binding Lrp family transcriptional regulator